MCGERRCDEWCDVCVGRGGVMSGVTCVWERRCDEWCDVCVWERRYDEGELH